MEQTKLSILILQLESRIHLSEKLLDELEKQIKNKPVEVLTFKDNGSLTSGIKRQQLVDQAKGEYLCFLDDDDWITFNYIEKLLEGCNSKSDVVTFKLHMIRSDRRPNEIWSYGLCDDARKSGRMAANHLCAWKADLAKMVGWCPYLGYADDQVWYKPLLATGLPRTEYHIHDVLYEYRFNRQVSCNQKTNMIKKGKHYCSKGLRCYWTPDEKVVVEVGLRKDERTKQNGRQIRVVNNSGKIETHSRQKLKKFTTIRIS